MTKVCLGGFLLSLVVGLLGSKVHVEALNAETPDPEEQNTTARCLLPKYTGPCRAAFPHYYYDADSRTCKLFTYGGCDGNANNFEMMEDCEKACSGVTADAKATPDSTTPAARAAPRRLAPLPEDSTMSSDPEEPLPEMTTPPYAVSSEPEAPLPEMDASDFAERCEAAPEVGPCRAALRHWYYNSKTRTCQTFLYGGCRGNKNNYLDISSCMATCTVSVIPSPRRVAVDTQSPPEIEAADDHKEHCEVASDEGPCRAAFPMFYYEHSSGTCRSFIYGGCRGNNNRYKTREECMARCTGEEGRMGKKSWTPVAPFFLIATLAAISALLLAGLVLITLRRSRLHRQLSTISDKEGLLPDEQSSVESLSIEGSPKLGKA